MDMISSSAHDQEQQQQQHSNALFPSEASGLFGSGFSSYNKLHASRSGFLINNNIGPADQENDDDEWSRLKICRVDDPAIPAPASLFTSARSTSRSLFPPDSPQMLNFSSWKPDALPLTHSSPPSSSSASSSLYLRNAGMVAGLPGGGSRGGGGGFTHSQWFELERQALIYKYMDAKVPVPSYLLIPAAPRPSLLFPSLAASGSAAPMGWGSLHLAFSGNAADPEPGRCKRTDGKKWRCSRDAVPDQKYCERHMNRGRHRSRKRVEGQSGHAGKAGVPAITSSQSAPAVSSSPTTSSSSLSLGKCFTRPPSLQFNSSLMNKQEINQPTRKGPNSMLTYLSPNSSRENQNPFEIMSDHSDFGLISTDSLRSCSSENRNFIYPDPKITDRHQPAGSHPFRHFIDNWSKNQSNDKTELSISIPMASSDFSSSSSSPNQDKMSFSPLRLSCEFNPLNSQERGSSWIPISWQPTVGGPLGEVLTNTGGTPKDLQRNLSSSSLNLLTDGWTLSRRFESSPTGVLQKSGFGSLSSSARSSPRAENFKAHGHESDELLGSINLC